jgi:hypothetical protein
MRDLERALPLRVARRLWSSQVTKVRLGQILGCGVVTNWLQQFCQLQLGKLNGLVYAGAKSLQFILPGP